MVQDQLIVLSRNTKITKKKSSFKTWKSDWKKKSVTERVVLWIMLVIFCIYGFSLIFPVLWALVNSFKDVKEYNEVSKFAFPTHLVTDNYEKVFNELTSANTSIIESIWNSVWMSTLSTVLGLIASSLTSYVCAKYRFKMSKFIYALVVFVQIIPLVGGIAGMYDLIHVKLEIANEPFLIWPMWFGGFGFSFLMLYSAFKSVPWSYAESAFIDGAGHFTTFVRIMLPSVKPVLASLFVVNFIGAWNDYMTAYLYMNKYSPLALTVYTLQNDATRMGMPVYLAVICISILPPLLLFIFFQKLIMENTTAGGLKG